MGCLEEYLTKLTVPEEIFLMAIRILMAEDDRVLLNLASTALRNEGYQVEEVVNGIVAMERIENENFDLVISDVWMPGIDGIELLNRSQHLPKPPKVIVITADHTSSTLLKVIREQAYKFIKKPFGMDLLLETVKDSLRCSQPVHRIEVISAKPEWVELRVPCHLATIDRIHDFILGLELDLPDETREDVARAFRELLLNAAEWGGKFDPKLHILVSCLRTDRMILYRIKDPGSGFDPSDLTHAAICNPEDHPFRHIEIREQMGLRPGGFGILTVQALADDLIYNEDRNEVVFIKYLDSKT